MGDSAPASLRGTAVAVDAALGAPLSLWDPPGTQPRWEQLEAVGSALPARLSRCCRAWDEQVRDGPRRRSSEPAPVPGPPGNVPRPSSRSFPAPICCGRSVPPTRCQPTPRPWHRAGGARRGEGTWVTQRDGGGAVTATPMGIKADRPCSDAGEQERLQSPSGCRGAQGGSRVPQQQSPEPGTPSGLGARRSYPTRVALARLLCPSLEGSGGPATLLLPQF